jgi:hypothetical protein
MEYVLLYTTGTDPQPYDPATDNIGECDRPRHLGMG